MPVGGERRVVFGPRALFCSNQPTSTDASWTASEKIMEAWGEDEGGGEEEEEGEEEGGNAPPPCTHAPVYGAAREVHPPFPLYRPVAPRVFARLGVGGLGRRWRLLGDGGPSRAPGPSETDPG